MTHHRSHVVLLPQGAGWEWYQALQDYILRFRPTLTQSADDAVSFRGEQHTITVIHPTSWNQPGAARQPNQEDDILAWLKNPKNTANAKFDLDVIRVTEPAALRRLMAQRILVTGRFGKSAAVSETVPTQPAPPPPLPALEQQKLTLVWPSDYKVYTQKFGQRPDYYSKFGLPGHEGVDIRAPNGTNIYACADGVVTLAGWRKAGHPYGYSIRLRHKRNDGEYETIYAHLTEGSAKVKVGDAVKAGQLIALADNTGNTSAAHLHLSLKKIGAKNGGYGEIIDPEPFFVNAPK
ncbi:MAG TPA: M23 family metallopeptidase [Anaerolineae bacterium]|nr:M23 family metallopeptidase [Anaerolineae bacterium]